MKGGNAIWHASHLAAKTVYPICLAVGLGFPLPYLFGYKTEFSSLLNDNKNIKSSLMKFCYNTSLSFQAIPKI